ncbi:MAG: triose-phosphate isomerase [Desulfovibrionaceae bacterium]
MRKLMAANWKMYKTAAEAAATACELATLLNNSAPEGREVLIFPPFTAISATVQALQGATGMAVGGQNVYPATEGAFTGEISPAMLCEAGATWVLTGHSERRHILGETDTQVGEKTAFALNAGLNVVFCIGETLAEREGTQLHAVLERQITLGLSKLSADVSAENIAIAYEPVWAIGTGKVAGLPEILETHALVRTLLVARFGKVLGHQVRILYGGSVKPNNASAIIQLDNVDGVLVGGASLQSESFKQIVSA